MQLYFSIENTKPLEEFETFAGNLELNLDTVAKKQPFLIVLLGDLNVKLSKWYENVDLQWRYYH